NPRLVLRRSRGLRAGASRWNSDRLLADGKRRDLRGRPLLDGPVRRDDRNLDVCAPHLQAEGKGIPAADRRTVRKTRQPHRRQPPFRILLVSLRRCRDLQDAERNRRTRPRTARRRHHVQTRGNERLAGHRLFPDQRGAALRAFPAAPRAPLLLAHDARRSESALEPRDVPQPAPGPFQRNGIRRPPREGPRMRAGDRRYDPQAEDQHRFPNRIPHGGARRRLDEPILQTPQRNHRAPPISPRRYDKIVRSNRSRVTPLRRPPPLGQTPYPQRKRTRPTLSRIRTLLRTQEETRPGWEVSQFISRENVRLTLTSPY